VSVGTTLGASDVVAPVAVPTTGAKAVMATIGATENTFPAAQTQYLYLTLSNDAASVNVQLDFEPGP
jgi:hypothetical protein